MSTKFDYVGMQATADALLQEFGMSAVLRRVGIPDRPCVVAIIDYLPKDQKSALANPTDRRVLISPLTPDIQAIPPDNELDQLVTFVQPPANPPVVDEILPFAEPLKKFSPAGVNVLYQGTVRR